MNENTELTQAEQEEVYGGPLPEWLTIRRFTTEEIGALLQSEGADSLADLNDRGAAEDIEAQVTTDKEVEGS
jgi:hypothetical protein